MQQQQPLKIHCRAQSCPLEKGLAEFSKGGYEMRGVEECKEAKEWGLEEVARRVRDGRPAACRPPL